MCSRLRRATVRCLLRLCRSIRQALPATNVLLLILSGASHAQPLRTPNILLGLLIERLGLPFESLGAAFEGQFLITDRPGAFFESLALLFEGPELRFAAAGLGFESSFLSFEAKMLVGHCIFFQIFFIFSAAR